MQEQSPTRLHDKDSSLQFYEERYAHGYMDEWPIEKKRRIFEVIRSLGLPDVGEALDFGCGNGVFTDVVRQALAPGWKVYGADISSIAIENAGTRYPQCGFFVTDALTVSGKRFDFIFTHHVLEHVYDLSQALDGLDALLKDDSAVLHVLPCGNENSFEHSVCRLRRDGINPELENRFFFEDEGHLRRLSSEQLTERYARKGFYLAKEYYSSQYWGAIDWITQAGPGFILLFTDQSSALDQASRARLKRLRVALLFFWILRFPARFVESRLRRESQTLRDLLFWPLSLLGYVFAKPVDVYLNRKALDEWERKRGDRRGSEMFLFFKRQPS